MWRIDFTSRSMLVSLTLLIALNILALLGTKVDQKAAESLHQACRGLLEVEAYRDAQILQLNLGLVKTYDQVSEAGRRAEALIHDLEAIIGRMPATQRGPFNGYLEQVKANHRRRQDAATAFATENSSLLNSRRFLPVLIAQAGHEIEESIGRDAHLELQELSARATAFVLSGEPMDTALWNRRWEKLHQAGGEQSIQSQLKLVRAHAEMILSAKPKVDEAIHTFLNVHPQHTVDALMEAHKRMIEQRAGRQTYLKASLYTSVMVLIVGALILHSKTRRLSRELQVLNSELEQKVVARTQELTLEMEVRRRAEEDLVKSRDAAEAGNRAKSEFIATMSHEIRTPMNGVLGFADLLMDSPLDEHQRQYVQIIKSSGEGLTRIINDILDFSKIEAGKMEVSPSFFLLDEIVSQAVQILHPRILEKNLNLVLDTISGVSCYAFADPIRTRQILINLLGNAVKFTLEGSITLRQRAHEGRIRISVIDTGIGIPVLLQSKMFKAFTQADSSTTRQYGGTGLGLVISKRLAELMGGQVGFESEEGKGSTFWFEIPEALGNEQRSVIEPISEVDPGEIRGVSPKSALVLPKPGVRVLAAEDNHTNQVLLRRILEKMGCHMDLATQGREAVELYMAHDYDCVLMDFHMPIMDGLEATREIRKLEQTGVARGSTPSTRHTPIIALTASAREEDRMACLDAGMDDHLSKPIQLDDLRAKLAQWVNAESHSADQRPQP